MFGMSLGEEFGKTLGRVQWKALGFKLGFQ